LALLIGASQAEIARRSPLNLVWLDALSIPKSRERILLIGKRGH